jgi:hypothetical protein
MLKDRLIIRLGKTADIFTPEELNEFLDSAISGHDLEEGKDDILILDLALAACYLRLATDSATYFKYSQADESVDKSMTPEMFRKLYATLWSSCCARLGIPVEPPAPPAASEGAPDTFILHKDEEEC